MRLDDNYRMTVVAEYWASGLTQEEFCRLHPVTPRALRSWTRLAEAKDPSGRVSQVLDRAITEMEKLRASVTPAPPKPARSGPQDHEAPCNHREPEPELASPTPRATTHPAKQPAAIPAPPPEPARATFDWNVT